MALTRLSLNWRIHKSRTAFLKNALCTSSQTRPWVESLKTKYQNLSLNYHPFWFRKDKLGDWVYESGSSGIHEWVNRPKQFSDDFWGNVVNPGMWWTHKTIPTPAACITAYLSLDSFFHNKNNLNYMADRCEQRHNIACARIKTKEMLHLRWESDKSMQAMQ